MNTEEFWPNHREFFLRVQQEMAEANREYGDYESLHEMASVLREEYEEFWDLVKQWKGRLPSNAVHCETIAVELMQIASVASRGAIQLLNLSRAIELNEENS